MCSLTMEAQIINYQNKQTQIHLLCVHGDIYRGLKVFQSALLQRPTTVFFSQNPCSLEGIFFIDHNYSDISP